MNRARWASALVLPFLLVAKPAMAQHQEFIFKLAGGYGIPTGSYSDNLEGGWQGQIGVGYTPKGGNGGLTIEYSRSWNNVKDEFLRSVGIPDGQSRLWSLTLNGLYMFGHSHLRPYVIAGGGLYHRTVDFYGGTVQVPVFDPWWGYVGTVPAQTVLGSFGDDAFGVNGGLGLLFRVGEAGSAIFIESRYHYGWTNGVDSQVLPIMFGFAYRY